MNNDARIFLLLALASKKLNANGRRILYALHAGGGSMACLTNYTVQCRDATSGETGCFLFDTSHWQRTGEFRAVSPVMPDLDAFYAWDNANGTQRKSCYLERIGE